MRIQAKAPGRLCLNAMAGHAGCQRKMYVGITHPTPCAKHLQKEEKHKEHGRSP